MRCPLQRGALRRAAALLVLLVFIVSGLVPAVLPLNIRAQELPLDEQTHASENAEVKEGSDSTEADEGSLSDPEAAGLTEQELSGQTEGYEPEVPAETMDAPPQQDPAELQAAPVPQTAPVESEMTTQQAIPEVTVSQVQAKPQAEPDALYASRAASPFVTEPYTSVDGSVTGLCVTGFNGPDIPQSLTIPPELEDREGRLLPVVAIGDLAFADKGLTELSLPDSLYAVGDNAFRDNLLQELDLKRIVHIGNSAFRNNRLTALQMSADPAALRTIGDYAFAGNRLSAVWLPASLETEGFGMGVFTDNGLFTAVTTEAAIPVLEKEPGPYGYVVNPVTIRVRFTDEEGREIRMTEIYGEDRTDADKLAAAGTEQSFAAPPISGYKALNPTLSITPSAGPDAGQTNVLTFVYQKFETAPILRLKGSEPVEFALNSDGSTEALLKLVEAVPAKDDAGNDIAIASFTVTPGEVDTTRKNQSLTLTYTAEDIYGNVTVLEVAAKTEGDMRDLEIGGGWVLGDFTFGDNKTTVNGKVIGDNVVTGFSESGKQKILDNHELVLPHINYQKPYTPVDTVGPSAFMDNHNIFSVSDPRRVIKKVEQEAFYRAGLRTIELPALQEAGRHAFFDNQTAHISLPELTSAGHQCFSLSKIETFEAPKLRTAGQYCFNYNKLSRLELPELETAGYSAFSNNQLELIRMPKLQAIPIRGFDDNALTEIGPDFFPSVTRIENYAFDSNKIRQAFFPNLQIADPHLFDAYNDTYPDERIGLPEYNHQVVIWCENTNVRSTPNYLVNPKPEDMERIPNEEADTFTEDDFVWDRENPARLLGFSPRGLKKIEYYSGTLVLPERAEIIGARAFENCLPRKINEHTRPAVHKIVAKNVRVIEERGLYKSGVKDFDLPKLEVLEDDALTDYSRYVIPLKLNFSKLKHIGSNALRGNVIGQVSFDELISVGTYALYDTGVSEFIAPKLEVMKPNVFGNEVMRMVYLGNAIKELPKDAFLDANSYAAIIIDNPPKSYPPGVAEIGYKHVINPVPVIIRYLEEGTDKELSPPGKVYAVNDLTYVETPLIDGYALSDSSQSSFSIERSYKGGEKKVYYRKIETAYIEGTELYQYTDLDNPDWIPRELIGDPMRTRVFFSATGINYKLEEGGALVLRYDPTYVDQNKLDNYLRGLRTYYFDKYLGIPKRVTDGVIKIPLKTIEGGTNLDIPMEWHFLKDVTPDNYRLEIKASIFDNKQNLVQAAAPVYVEGYYRKPEMLKHSPVSAESGAMSDSRDGARSLGEFKEAEDLGLLYVPEDQAVPVPFYFSFEQLNRTVSGVELKDILPVYDAYVPGKGVVKKTAVLCTEESGPLWSLDNDGKVVSLKLEGFEATLRPEAKIPRLYLAFPGIIEGAPALNKVEAVLTPDKQGARELPMKTDDTLTIYAKKHEEEIPPPSAEIVYQKDHMNLPRSDGSGAFFYDKEKDRVKNIPFKLSLTKNPGTLDFRHAVITDYDLDPRLQYTGVAVGQSADVIVTVQAYAKTNGTLMKPEEDEVLDSQTLSLSSGGGIQFPESVQTRIDYVQIIFPADHNLSGSYSFIINSRLRHPETPQVAGNIYSSANRYRNDSVLSCDRFAQGSRDKISEEKEAFNKSYQNIWDGLQGTFFYEDDAYVSVRPLQYSMGMRKTQTYSNMMLQPGEQGSYTLSLVPQAKAKGSGEDLFDVTLNDFEMVDILPYGLDLLEVKLSDEFRASGGSHTINHEWQVDKNNPKALRTAVIFKADTLQPDVVKIAELKTEISPAASEGALINKAYTSWENIDEVEPIGYKEKPGDYRPEREWIEDQAPIHVLKIIGVIARKYISTDKLNWSQGADTEYEQTFYYKLQLINATDEDRHDIEIIDVFPFDSDRQIQSYKASPQDSAKTVSRDSQFSNDFSLSPDDVEIYIRSEKETYEVKAPELELMRVSSDSRFTYNSPFRTAESLLSQEGPSWRPLNGSGSSPAKALHIKFKDDFALKPNEKLEIIIKVRAPSATYGEHKDYKSAGKKAYNSFVRRDNSTFRFLEPGAVWNRMKAPQIPVQLTKYGETAERTDKVLEGAVFRLTSVLAEGEEEQNRIRYTAQSDANGLVLFPKVDVSKDYILEEISAPKGYSPSPHRFTINASKLQECVKPDGNHLTYIVPDAKKNYLNPLEYTGTLKLRKLLKGTTIPLPNISFRLQGLSTENQELDLTLITNQQGEIRQGKLKPGDYILTELPREGYSYFKPVDPIEFTIDAAHKNIRFGIFAEDGNELQSPVMRKPVENEELVLRINKIALEGEVKNAQLHRLTAAGKTLLDGYSFELRRYSADGKMQESSETEPTSGGFTTVQGLKPETIYSLKEKQESAARIANYAYNDKEYFFKFNSEGKLVELEGPDKGFSEIGAFVENRVNFPNATKEAGGKIVLKKLTSEGTALQGAAFELKLKKGSQEISVEGYKDPVESDAAGNVVFERLQPGTYVIREVKAPVGYLADPVWHDTGKLFIIPDVLPEKTDLFDEKYSYHVLTAEVVNRPIRISVLKGRIEASNVSKARADQLLLQNVKLRALEKLSVYDVYEPLSGAVFELREGSENGPIVKECERLVSGKDGLIMLPEGKLEADKTYVLCEITAPEGYQISTIPLRFIPQLAQKGADDQGVIRFLMDNQPLSGEIIISKYLIGDTSSMLRGIHFELYRTEPGHEDVKIAEGETDAYGHLSFRNLQPGRYLVKEVPDGIHPPLDDIPVTLEEQDGFVEARTLSCANAVPISIPVTKRWVNSDPLCESVTVTLLKREQRQDGTTEDVPVKDENGRDLQLILSAGTDPAWTGSFNNLPRLDGKGQPIQYRLREEPLPSEVTEEVSTSVIGTPYRGFTVRNSVGTVEVSVTKEWTGRPVDPLEVKLYKLAEGEEILVENVDPAYLSAENAWTYTFENLPKYEQTVEGWIPVRYLVKETLPELYASELEVRDDGHTFILKNREMTRIPVEKHWQVPEGAVLPESVTMYLLRDGERMPDPQDESRDMQLVLTAENGWRGVFEGLWATQENGLRYTYTVEESEQEGYETRIEFKDGVYIVTNIKYPREDPPREYPPLPPGEPPVPPTLKPYRPGVARLPRTGENGLESAAGLLLLLAAAALAALRKQQR